MRILYLLLQWTWGLPQNALGALLFLFFRKQQRFPFRYAVATRWTHKGSLSLGMFLFLGNVPAHLSAEDRFHVEQSILVHEYGHTIQSLILGPLYLLVIGLPSLLWANAPGLRRFRIKRGISYYSMYQEKWANHLGKRVTKLMPPQ